GLDRDSEHLIEVLLTQENIGRIWQERAGNSRFFRRIYLRDFANQLSRTLRCAQNHFWIDAAFESVTGIARQIQFARSSPDTRRQKVSALQQDGSRRFGHAGILSAHHAADRDRAFVISDDQALRRERISFTVECEKFLTVARQPNVDAAS